MKLTGRITINGETPPKGGTVFFLPLKVADGLPQIPATARFEPDGTFSASTFDGATGIIPGEYKVYVKCWKKPPMMAGPPPISYIPDKFTAGETSDLRVVADGSKPLELDFPLAN